MDQDVDSSDRDPHIAEDEAERYHGEVSKEEPTPAEPQRPPSKADAKDEPRGPLKPDGVKVVECECGAAVHNNELAIREHIRSATRHRKFVEEQALKQWVGIQPPFHRLEHLNAAINHFFATRSPNVFDLEAREAYRDKLERFISRFYPGAQVLTFGSTASLLFSPDSDLDFCLKVPGLPSEAESQVIRHLMQLFEEQGAGHMTGILRARVPILKLEEPRPDCGFTFKFDMCINRPLGERNSRLVREYTRLDKRVRPLAYFLKEWCARAHLMQRNHGLTSYCLQLMLIFFLQTLSEPVVCNLQVDNHEKADLVSDRNCYFAEAETVGWCSANKARWEDVRNCGGGGGGGGKRGGAAPGRLCRAREALVSNGRSFACRAKVCVPCRPSSDWHFFFRSSRGDGEFGSTIFTEARVNSR
eukprot:TRINITY_DN1421_c0_g1_i1.p1 TRINITY_DN1421_c0_g1~~TRINITY_DN1421_c0_g1_i1.p1  ORF type:complete len:416 (-),score=32.11 TRINITY_DN1421_c0_g1_i1:40-1287(-)